MKLDLHIHSKYSYDSFSDPSKIVKVAERKGLDVISITDHDNMRVYEDFPRGHGSGVTVIQGMEIKTDAGDVIGLFLNEEVRSRSFVEVVGEIRDRGGVVVLPHPFRRKCDPNGLIEFVDLVEVINARSKNVENVDASRLCERFGKMPVTGSDAHTYFEIGRAVTEIDGYSDDPDEIKKILLGSERRCYGKETPFYISHGCSFISSRIKRWGGL